MKIAILGSGKKAAAWESKNDASFYTWVQDTKTHNDYDIFVDLDFDENPERITQYAKNNRTYFVLSSCFITIEAAFNQFEIRFEGQKMIGINALAGMINRSVAEITNPFNIPQESIDSICKLLKYESFRIVNSRVGMVTPRIICMIINEAFYTVQEGTAAATDIDIAMKLGTNYPKGPFEFLEEIGVAHVYLLLESIYNDTKEERYKICPALKQRYLASRVM